MANITGWGRSTWNDGAWGSPAPVTLSGLAGTSALGSVSLVTNNNVSVSVGTSTSGLGSPDIRIIFSTTIAGQSATGSVGSVTFDAEANVTLPSLSASLGSPSVDTIGNGWGRSTWGSGPFGMPVSQTRTITVSGFGMTSALGSVTAFTTIDINAPSFAITSALGTLTSVTGTANLTLSSLVGTSALGTVAAQGSAVAGVPGLNSTLGSVSVVASGDADITLTGFGMTSTLGTITTRSSNSVNVQGFFADIILGTDTAVVAKATITLTGFTATASTSSINIWQIVDDSQTPNWKEIAA